MLRINLLPSYVAQRRLSKRIIFGFAALFVLLAVGLIGWQLSVERQLTNETQLAAAAAQGQAYTKGIQTDAANELAQIGPITQKVDFVKQVHEHNLYQVQLYYRLAQYTYPKVIYTNAAYSGSTMTMSAYTPSFDILVDYLLRIRKDPDFTSVSISNVPNSSNAYIRKFFIGNTLIAVGSRPGTNGSNGMGGGPGMGNNSGMGGPPGMGGMGSPGAGAGGMMGGPGASQGSQYGQSLLSKELAASQKVTPLSQVIQSKINPLALPRQVAEYEAQLLQSIHEKRVPSGFFFTATATLANPQVLSPVAVPGSSTGTGAQGGPMGMPGGGYPGGPPPGMGGPVQTASNVP